LFPERLLDVELRGQEVLPHYLTGRDHRWVEAALDRVQASVGCSRAVVEQRFVDPPGLGERWQAWQAMTRLLWRLHDFEVRSCLDPRRLREVVFVEAARGAGATAAAERAAARLGVSPGELSRDLYADLPAERLLRPATCSLSTPELIERYNLALAQGLLLRAETLSVGLEGQAKSVLRWARLHRLLCSAEREPDGRLRLELSGPLALFHHTLKYGRAMAEWLPALTRSPRWRMKATCVVRGRRRSFAASYLDPIGSSHGPPRRFDSAVEEQLFRDLARAAPGWEVLREAEVVQIGRQLLTPDFTLVDRRRALRVAVEVVGFWTPEYVASKLDVLSRLPAHRRWVLCVDESLAATGLTQIPGAPAFLYRRRIDVPRFLVFLEGWLAQRRAA
jgi:uncharacterized protein